MKKIIWIVLAVSLLLAGCSSQKNAESEKQSLKWISQGQTIDVVTEESRFSLTQKEGNWYKETKVLPFMSSFFDAIAAITGEQTEKPKKSEKLFTLKSEGREIQFLKETDRYYFLEKNQAFLVTHPPRILSDYDSLFFTEATYELADLEDLSTLKFQNGEKEFTLSKETNLSKIEQAPFVSGWYMNDYYHRSYSIRYDQVQKLMQTLGQLLIEPTTQTAQTTSLVTTIQFKENENHSRKIQLYQDEEEYFLEVGEEFYRLSAYQAKQLCQAPMEWVDSFSALIMADALSSLSIEVGENHYMVTGQHTVKDDQLSLTSEFQVNQKIADEALFRKAYQYCGVLSGTQEYANQKISEVPYAKLSYMFISEGQKQTREVSYFPLLEDENLVAISENNQVDFVMEKNQLQEMEQAINSLIK